MNTETRKAVDRLAALVAEVHDYNSYHHPSERVCKGDIKAAFDELTALLEGHRCSSFLDEALNSGDGTYRP